MGRVRVEVNRSQQFPAVFLPDARHRCWRGAGREVRRDSPRMPPGRSSITPTMSAPIIKNRKLGSLNTPGMNWVPVQMPQTTKAPSTAPTLLPDPPTISMAQMMKVASRGSKVCGDRNRILWAYSAPPMPIITAPRMKACSLNLDTSLPLASVASSSSRIARSTRPHGEWTAW